MANKDHQKIQDLTEKRYFSDFCLRYAIDGAIQPKKKNQVPDVLVQQSNGLLGIEIVRLTDHPAKIEGPYRRLADRIKERIVAELNGSFSVTLLLFQYYELEKSRFHVLEEFIFDWIRRTSLVCTTPGESITLRNVAEYEEIQLVSFDRLSPPLPGDEEFRTLHHLQSGTVNQNPAARVQEVLNEKNRKVGSYLKNCDRVWLLLIADALNPESHFDFEGINGTVFESKFDKVLIYNVMIPNEIIELKKSSSIEQEQDARSNI
jgi:hypothetical protein